MDQNTFIGEESVYACSRLQNIIEVIRGNTVTPYINVSSGTANVLRRITEVPVKTYEEPSSSHDMITTGEVGSNMYTLASTAVSGGAAMAKWWRSYAKLADVPIFPGGVRNSRHTSQPPKKAPPKSDSDT